MLALILSTVCAGIFCGAAVYINFVEHPARMACGTEIAVREFAPSYRRATIMQASLAVSGTILGLIAAWRLHDGWAALGALALGGVVPFTLIVIFPTNKRLLDPALDATSQQAAELLRHWNQLHAMRSALSAVALGLLLWRVASG